jgi:hypothetical protein
MRSSTPPRDLPILTLSRRRMNLNESPNLIDNPAYVVAVVERMIGTMRYSENGRDGRVERVMQNCLMSFFHIVTLKGFGSTGEVRRSRKR